MGIVQNKQVAVDLSWKLKRIDKLIVKINGSRKVAQSAENMPKSQENKAYFDAPPISADALCATYV